MKKTTAKKLPPAVNPKKIALNQDMEELKPKKNIFCCQGVNFFLTYPNLDAKWAGTDYAKVHARQALSNKFKENLDKWFIVQETHKSNGDLGGKPHLHVMFSLHPNPAAINSGGQWKLQDRDFWLSVNIDGKHGDYAGCKNWVASIKYLSKEDKNPLTNYTSTEIEGLIKSLTTKKSSSHEIVALKIQRKELTSCQQVDKEFPGYVLQNSVKLEHYFTLHNEWASKKFAREWSGLCVGPEAPDTEREICLWFNSQIRWKPKTPREKRPRGMLGLMVCGDGDIGKTFLWDTILAEAIDCFPFGREKYHCNFTGKEDLIVFEDFKTDSIDMQECNVWLDGSKGQVAKKNKTALMKQSQIPIYCTTNTPIDDWFPSIKLNNRTAWDAWRSRWTYIEVRKIHENYRFSIDHKPVPPPPPTPEELPPTPPNVRRAPPLVPPTPPKKRVIDLLDEEDMLSDCIETPPTRRKSPVLKRTKSMRVIDAELDNSSPIEDTSELSDMSEDAVEEDDSQEEEADSNDKEFIDDFPKELVPEGIDETEFRRNLRRLRCEERLRSVHTQRVAPYKSRNPLKESTTDYDEDERRFEEQLKTQREPESKKRKADPKL